MSTPPAAPASAFLLDASGSAHLRNTYTGRMLRRDRLWRAPQFNRNVVIALVAVAILVNLLWILGLEHVMQRLVVAQSDRGPVVVNIIEPPQVFEVPPEPQPAPVEFRQRETKVQISPPVTRMTPPPLNADSSSQTQARIGTAGEPAVNLFNADGSLRMPEATTRIGPQPIDNPQEAARARWADIENRGENPLDCTRTRFAGQFRRDESLGDEVSRKYLKWIGLSDGAGIAERAAKREDRAADGCDPAG